MGAVCSILLELFTILQTSFSLHFRRTYDFDDDDDDKLQEEAMTWQAADFYDSGIQKLAPRFNKFLDNAGEYVEK
jgi:hypothetical protein